MTFVVIFPDEEGDDDGNKCHAAPEDVSCHDEGISFPCKEMMKMIREV